MKHSFKAKIYKTGINWAVDVPLKITAKMVPEKGRIYIRGKINGFGFSKTLMPVKDGPFRLYVNAAMMKGGNTALGKTAAFEIEQAAAKKEPMPSKPLQLVSALKKENLLADFESLTPSRKKDILKYLNHIRTEETMQRNIAKLIAQMKSRKSPRIP